MWEKLLSLCAEKLSFSEIRTKVNNYVDAHPEDRVFFTVEGWDNFYNDKIEEHFRQYLAQNTGLKDTKNREIYVCFSRYKTNKEDHWKIIPLTENIFYKDALQTWAKKMFGYHLGCGFTPYLDNPDRGRIIFKGKNRKDALEKATEFLKDLSEEIIEEDWDYSKFKNPQMPYIILQKYLDHLFVALRHKDEDAKKKLEELKENKKLSPQELAEEEAKVITDRIRFSKDNKYAAFHTNLLTKTFIPVYIIMEHRDGIFLNPSKLRRGFNELAEHNFPGTGDNMYPPRPDLGTVDEMIFRVGWKIDKNNIVNFAEHILKKRKYRLDEKYQNLSAIELSGKITTAIEQSQSMASINYRFVVPQYNLKHRQLQMLMPLYLDGKFNKRLPDIVLILNPNKERKYYTPATIIEPTKVYGNARLIAKPDNMWLSTEMINPAEADDDSEEDD